MSIFLINSNKLWFSAEINKTKPSRSVLWVLLNVKLSLAVKKNKVHGSNEKLLLQKKLFYS